jgi:hypothetical protein
VQTYGVWGCVVVCTLHPGLWSASYSLHGISCSVLNGSVGIALHVCLWVQFLKVACDHRMLSWWRALTAAWAALCIFKCVCHEDSNCAQPAAVTTSLVLSCVIRVSVLYSFYVEWECCQSICHQSERRERGCILLCCPAEAFADIRAIGGPVWSAWMAWIGSHEQSGTGLPPLLSNLLHMQGVTVLHPLSTAYRGINKHPNCWEFWPPWQPKHPNCQCNS